VRTQVFANAGLLVILLLVIFVLIHQAMKFQLPEVVRAHAVPPRPEMFRWHGARRIGVDC